MDGDREIAVRCGKDYRHRYSVPLARRSAPAVSPVICSTPTEVRFSQSLGYKRRRQKTCRASRVAARARTPERDYRNKVQLLLLSARRRIFVFRPFDVEALPPEAYAAPSMCRQPREFLSSRMPLVAARAGLRVSNSRLRNSSNVLQR